MKYLLGFMILPFLGLGAVIAFLRFIVITPFQIMWSYSDTMYGKILVYCDKYINTIKKEK